jgi:hypothetical protein
MSLIAHSRLAFCAMFCANVALCARAHAEPQPDSKQQEADRLFQDGLENMRAGKYDVACPHLAESYRIDPSPGALFTLAECEAGWHQLASALTDYQSFVSALTSMPAERRQTFEERRRIAAGQISVLNVSAPEVIIDVAPNHAPNLVVKFQGVVVPEASYGVGRRVDPGSYAVVAEVDGQPVWQRDITVEADSRAKIQVQPTHSGATPPTGDKTADSSHRTWLYVSGGVALAGVATGLVAGALAYGHKSSIDSNCPNLECNATGRSAVNVARAEARVSSVGFTLGIAGAAAAVLLLTLAPHPNQASPSPAARRSRFHFGVGNDLKSIRVTGQF